MHILTVENFRMAQFQQVARVTVILYYCVPLYFNSYRFKVCTCRSVGSLYIEFYKLYWSTIISNPMITTDPDLNVISHEDHGGELKVQQELAGPHPYPSHRGSPFGQKI